MSMQHARDVNDHTNDAPVMPPRDDAGDDVTISVEPAPDVQLPEDDPEASAPGGAHNDAPPISGDVDEPLITPEMVSPAVHEIYRYVARRRGPHWVLDDDEAMSIAEPLAGELSDAARALPFLGGAIDAVGGRRMQLALAVTFVTGPRLLEDGRLAGERARAEAPRPAQPTTDTRPAPDAGGGLGSLLPNT